MSFQTATTAIVCGISLILTFLFGRAYGSAEVQVKFSAAQIEWQQRLTTAQHETINRNQEYRNIEQALVERIQAAEESARILRSEYDKISASVTVAGNRLRNDITATSQSINSSGMSEDSFASCQRQYGELSIIVSECSEHLERVVAAADRQEIERRTCRDGYPK